VGKSLAAPRIARKVQTHVEPYRDTLETLAHLREIRPMRIWASALIRQRTGLLQIVPAATQNTHLASSWNQ
jgi:hypothetical protein